MGNTHAFHAAPHDHPFIYPRAGGWNETPPQTNTSSNNIIQCFQHTPESFGALINPRGEHHTKQASLHKRALPQSASQHTPTHTSALHFCARPTPLLSPDVIRATQARPLHPAASSIGFCVIWDWVVFVHVHVYVHRAPRGRTRVSDEQQYFTSPPLCTTRKCCAWALDSSRGKYYGPGRNLSRGASV